ncbi:MAG: MurR/RpiR family transcriptional regulator [Thermomicrobiales bacterium]
MVVGGSDGAPAGDGDETGLAAVDRAISAHYGTLSAGQRKVIDRLLADTRYGAVISAPELAAATGISEATVTRAAQALGFAGYPDLQRHLRNRFVAPVDDRLREDRAEDVAGVPGAIAARVLADDAALIREMAEDLSPDDVAATVAALVNAHRVLVIGERGSHGLALMLGIGLRLLLDDVRILTGSAGDLPDQLLGLGAGDVMVGISFRRVDRLTVEVLRQARTLGASTIALTDHRSSPAARAADRVLIARTGTLRLMPSFAPGASLVHAVLEEVAAVRRDAAGERLRTAETLWDAFDAYADE